MKATPAKLFAGVLLALSLSATAFADDRPDHYEGEPSETMAQALANLADYSARLEAILARDELGPEDTAEIHRLTYTLENALDRIDSEVDALEEALEEVHVASERYQVDTVRTQGRRFLDGAAPLAK